jgi:outer membrane protein assembly factor BamB
MRAIVATTWGGQVIWDWRRFDDESIPSPIYDDGIVFLMSGFQGNDLRAIRIADAKGNIDGTGAVVWSFDRDTPYVPSPILVNGVLYFLKTNSGLLSAFDAKTGKPHYQNQRLVGLPNVFSSPVAAGDRVYFSGREGATLVMRAGPTFEVLATNQLDDGFDASPALVDTDLYLRGYKYLYAIGR